MFGCDNIMGGYNMMGVTNIFDGYNMMSGGNMMNDGYNMIVYNRMDRNLVSGNIYIGKKMKMTK